MYAFFYVLKEVYVGFENRGKIHVISLNFNGAHCMFLKYNLIFRNICFFI